MNYEVKFTSYSRKDFDSLDNSQKNHIRKSLLKIEKDGMLVGQPLHGDLSDCRKLKHKRLGLRMLFKESDLGIEIIEIVVIGKRDDQEVYNIAENRLRKSAR